MSLPDERTGPYDSLADFVRDRPCWLRDRPEHRDRCTGWSSANHGRSKGALGYGGERSEWRELGRIDASGVELSCPTCEEWVGRELDRAAAYRTAATLRGECDHPLGCCVIVLHVRAGNLFDVCHAAHMEEHRIGRKSFEAKYGIDVEERCREVGRQYEALVGAFL